MKKKLITSALPYVNNVPHLGNIIGCVLSGDVYARFCRSRGYETLYICGNDEYGTATENKAREEGLTHQEVCDKYNAIHVDIYNEFNIKFDVFGRTSVPEQTEISQSIFKDLDEAGFIKEETSERTYCEKDNIFLADRFVEGTCPQCGYEDARGDQCDSCGRLLEPENLVDPRCKICGEKPIRRNTTHLYLALDILQERLANWIGETQDKGNWTNNAIQTTASWLEKGLLPRPITRDLKWGVPVPKPGFENKVFYVWFDAPIGYISITARAYPDTWKDWWQNPEDVELYQFMAKDNIPFHTVIFPSSLLGTGKNWTMLHHIDSTEYLNYEDSKFSKSRNNGVFGTDVKETGIHTDLWRFYLLMIRPERNDSAFNWDEFFLRVNRDFIDNIGNMINRSLVFLTKNFDSELRDLPLSPEHEKFISECGDVCKTITEALEEVKMRDALRQLLVLGNIGNKFFQDMQPWSAIKTDPDHAQATVTLIAYLIQTVAIGLKPFMPETSDRIFSILGIEPKNWSDFGSFHGLDKHRIGKTEILYKNLDLKEAKKFRKRFSGDRPDPGIFHLRVGQIKEVNIHPTSDRLYVLEVDAGEGKIRTIVAGLKKHYTPEDLKDMKVIVLANLKPAEIRGVSSEGMVLVCEKRKKMKLLEAEQFEIGAIMGDSGSDLIEIETFKNAPFAVVDGIVTFDEETCLIGEKSFGCSLLPNGKVR